MTAFNWRDYLAVEKASNSYLDKDGKLKPSAQSQSAAENRDTLDGIARLRVTEKLIEQAMDQISLIPEMQEVIKKAHQVAAERAKKYPDYVKGFNGKIDIVTSRGTTSQYFWNLNQISAIPKEILEKQFFSSYGLRNLSLQHVLVHELHHAADASLSPDKDLAHRKQALQEAVITTLEARPDLRNEYETKQTLGGLSIGKLLAINDLNTFVTVYEQENRKATTLNSDSNPYRVFDILNEAYEEKLKAIVAAQSEAPVIAATNAIMKKYFGEPTRIGHGINDLILNPKEESFFSSRIHPSLLPGLPLSPTAQCPGTPTIDTCSAAHIGGVFYKAEGKSAPAIYLPAPKLGP
jgi:hypothetical protein